MHDDDEQENQTRYIIGENTYNLLETDAVVDSAEDIAIGNTMFLEIIKMLENDKQRAIALGLYLGYNTVEVAYMLGCSKQWVYEIRTRMKERLEEVHKKRLD